MKDWKTKLIGLAAIVVATIVVDILILNYSSEKRMDDGSIATTCIAKVISVDAGKASGEPPSWTYAVEGQILTLKITSGKYKGKEVFATNALTGDYSDRILRVGDRLYVNLIRKSRESESISSVNLGEHVRARFLLYLLSIFLSLLVLVGGMKGVKTILALGLSLVFILSIQISASLKGYNPILIAILVSTLNTVVTFLLVGDISLKSLAGILGTIGGLAVTSILAYVSGVFMHFTGLDFNFGFLTLGKLLWMTKASSGWDYEGLLVAGMIIGASGAMMDASMAVASAIDEVKKANPKTSIMGCIRAGLNVGKDEMGMMANTLIFAYIGADMTLILVPMIQFGEAGRAMPFIRVINEEATSAEIVQALSGTIGLITAIPITAFIAGILIGRKRVEETSHESLMTIPNSEKVMFRRQWFIVPISLAILSIGVHVAYILARGASESQVTDKASNVVAEYVGAITLEKSEPVEVPGSDALGKGLAKNETIRAKLLGGHFKGQEVIVQNVFDPNRPPLYNVNVKRGTEILLKLDGTKEGIISALMVNYNRIGYIIYITGIFLLVMVMVGRLQGLRTAFALGISIAIVLKLLVPMIVKGYNALFATVIACSVIAGLSLIIVTGFNRKSASATLGIIGGVLVASLIVLYSGHKLKFTGISSSRTAIISQFTGQEKLDFRNILMAGILMGLLGTATDAAMAVASAVREIRMANPKMPTFRLVNAGMNVGKDLLGTMSNTLVFAYLGLRLILLMTFAGTSIFAGSKMEILSVETISAEILRLLAGSIGLFLTIPITAIVSALWDRIVSFLGLTR